MRRALVCIAWVAVVCIAFAFAFLAGSAAALAAALVALFAPLCGLLAVSLAAKRVGASLDCPTTAQKGVPVSCVLRVSNPSAVPLLRVEAHLRMLNMLTEEETLETIVVSVAARAEAEYPFALQSPLCGRVSLTLDKLVCHEPVSVFARSVDMAAERRFSVMPELHSCHIRELLSAAPLSDTSAFSPYVKGSDASETFSLREYEDGDDVRQIHWKLSAKTDELVVREASLPIDNSVSVFWDKSLFGADADPLRADAMASLVLSVCQMLAEQGMQFEVVSNDAGGDTCSVRDVLGEDDIYELIGHLMSTPLVEGESSAIAAYEQTAGPVRSSRIIYIACGQPPELAAARAQGSLMLFVCDDAVHVEARPGTVVVHFPKDDVAAALMMAGAV